MLDYFMAIRNKIVRLARRDPPGQVALVKGTFGSLHLRPV